MQIGDRVFRKGHSLQWGIVRRLFRPRLPFETSTETSPTHAEVDWHAPNRRGGRGFHRSTLKLSGLVLATEEELLRRKERLKTRA